MVHLDGVLGLTGMLANIGHVKIIDFFYSEYSVLFFFFWNGLRVHIACSLLGDIIPAHNIGYRGTRICPSSVLGCSFSTPNHITSTASIPAPIPPHIVPPLPPTPPPLAISPL